MENIQSLVDSVYDICQLDVLAQQKDSQLVVTWPMLSQMTQQSVPWHEPQTRPNTLYIHIPFCTGICTYCNYVTKSMDADSNEIQVYLDLLAKEAELLCRALRTDRVVLDSIYIGGGTPSMLRPKDLHRLLGIIDSFFTLNPNCEFTLEGCPETLTADKLAMLQNSSVNRISIGVETFDDEILSAVNRRHTAQQSKLCVEQIHRHNFADFDVDLINNLPNSTTNIALEDCRTVIDLLIPSVTLYHYHVKPKSIDSKKTPRHRYLEIKNKEILLHKIYQDNLCQVYGEYMIDWYSRGNLRFRHQLLKWQHDANQLTLGMGCYGYYEGTQFNTHHAVKTYRSSIEKELLPIMRSRTLQAKEIDKRKYLFNLRQNRLIMPARHEDHGHAIKKLHDLDLLTRTKDGDLMINQNGSLFFDDIQRLLAD